MEIKTATWGWYPPKYELLSNNTFKIYFNPVEKTQTVTHIDPETNEETSEEVTVYLVNYVEKNYPELLQAIKDKNDVLVSRLLLIERINGYADSSNVKSITLNNQQVWWDKATRVGLANSLPLEKESGEETTTLWGDNIKIDLSCDKAIEYMKQIEVYAIKCKKVTALHLEQANTLNTIEELDNYDYRANYPEKLILS